MEMEECTKDNGSSYLRGIVAAIVILILHIKSENPALM